VIEHVAHPDELLRHLKRFLEPGGRLLLTTPNGAYFRNKLPTFSEVKDFEELEGKQFKPDADGHLFLFTPNELAELAKSVGWAVEHLSVWGTPILNGHVLFRVLANRSLMKIAYGVEHLTQHLPLSERKYICFAMSAILRAES
jgi:2-polyprenyl-6-hydroxyphenyl methylase/3-demethylubiquinone-9 3-methyltransferase